MQVHAHNLQQVRRLVSAGGIFDLQARENDLTRRSFARAEANRKAVEGNGMPVMDRTRIVRAQAASASKTAANIWVLGRPEKNKPRRHCHRHGILDQGWREGLLGFHARARAMFALFWPARRWLRW